MNKKIIELLDSIKTKKQEVINLTDENKLEEAKKSKEELVQLQNKLNILYDLEDGKDNNIKDNIKDKEPISQENKITEEKAFINAIKNTALGNTLSAEVVNALKTSEDEGVVIPHDISTKVRELRRETKSLETLVNIEQVQKIEGSRVVEKNADIVGFEAVDEEGLFPDMDKPQFTKIPYKLKKLGGILKATNEFYQTSDDTIKGYIIKWIAKKGTTTRNNLILKAIDTKKESGKVAIAGVDTLKDIINTKLDPAILNGTQIITNQDGFNWLDKIKDKSGKYILQPDITQKFDYLLFGKYPVIVFSNKQIKTSTNKAPVYIGNLKEFITLFDFEKLFIETSAQAGDLWEKDMIGIKVRERLDVQVVDENALVKGEIDTTSPVEVQAFSLENNEEMESLKEEKENLEKQNTVLLKEKEKLAKELEKLQAKTEGK